MVTTSVLVDEDSDTSLASVTFVRKLGRKELGIAGVSGERTERSQFQRLNLLTGVKKNHTVNVWTLPKLCEAVTPFEWKVLQYCITDLNLETPLGPIYLLLGMGHPELLVPKEVRRGKDENHTPFVLTLDG